MQKRFAVLLIASVLGCGGGDLPKASTATSGEKAPAPADQKTEKGITAKGRAPTGVD